MGGDNLKNDQIMILKMFETNDFFFISHLFQSVPWIKIQPEIHFVQKVCSVVGSLHQRYAHQRQHASPSTYFVKQIERPNAMSEQSRHLDRLNFASEITNSPTFPTEIISHIGIIQMDKSPPEFLPRSRCDDVWRLHCFDGYNPVL